MQSKVDRETNPDRSISAKLTLALKRIQGFLIFTFLYAGVNVVYLSNFRVWGFDYRALFLTSPFNPIEITSSHYASYLIGEIMNFGVTSLLVLGSDIYYQAFAVRFRAQIRPAIALLIAICASYVLSALTWAANGVPSTGTSVVGFTMACLILFGTISDFGIYQREKLHEKGLQAPSPLKTMAFVALFVLSLTSAFALFLVGNSQYWLHLAGGTISLVLLGLYIRRSAFTNVPDAGALTLSSDQCK